MTTINASKARQGLFSLLKGAIDQNQLYRISYRSGEAVLMSEEEYDSLMETLHLLSTPGFRKAYKKAKEDIKQGKTLPWQLAIRGRRGKI
ncbi:MAG: type II toxin-antitoxin system Phd/YefM family antitoxin [Deltaproteobacteria bacterium]|nr:type II toxin-antitoxin system Phd/YefM family antitoxin [Deltaproteobacteria bacterium]